MSDTQPWYAVVDGKGNLVSTGTSVADAATLAASGYTAITLASDPTGQVWNPSTKTFSPAPPKPTILDPWMFVQRFTPQEYSAVAGSTDPIVRQFLLMVTVAKQIDVGDATVQGGIQYLATTGLITSARAAVIGAQ